MANLQNSLERAKRREQQEVTLKENRLAKRAQKRAEARRAKASARREDAPPPAKRRLESPAPLRIERAPKVSYGVFLHNGTVYLRFRTQESSVQISLRFRCKSEDLDRRNWIARGDRAGTEILQTWRTSVLEAEARMFRLGEVATPQRMRQYVLASRGQALTPTVREALLLQVKFYHERYEAGRISEKTLVAAQKHTNGITAWLEAKHSNLRFSDLKGSHGDSFYRYFTLELKHSIGYARKRFSFFRQAINYGIRQEWVNRDPFVGWRNPREKRKAIEYLTQDELTALERLRFANPAFELVTDCFLACCYSGLAYIDLKCLSDKQLVNYDGIPSICAGRTKNGQHAVIPILPPLQALIDKYAGSPHRRATKRLFPVLSNQKMNQHLKAIGEIAGINKRLVTHMGRKTWATMVANLNVSEGSLARSMGHRTTWMTRLHYAHQQEASTVREILSKWQTLKTA